MLYKYAFPLLSRMWKQIHQKLVMGHNRFVTLLSLQARSLPPVPE